MTSEQRIEEFKKDLQEVLDRHAATISVANDDTGGSNWQIEVYLANTGTSILENDGITIFFESMEGN